MHESLKRKWLSEEVYKGLDKEYKPSYCIFMNSERGLMLLNKHVKNKSSVGIHADVDFDGVASGYETDRSLNMLGVKKRLIIVNSEKVHGIQQKHVDYFKKNKIIDLLIIVDSSTNNIDIIKQFECDVLVIDHHDFTEKETYGTCNDGIHEFVIINSTLRNINVDEDYKFLNKVNPEAFNKLVEYEGTTDMSCGLAVYEFMRIYFALCGIEDRLEKSLLYQWSALSLFTDSINMLNRRNQWYVQNTLGTYELETTLSNICKQINKYRMQLDKSFVQYKLAPIVNKAIRANEGAKVLDTILNRVDKFIELTEYDKLQVEAINSTYDENEYIETEYIMKNITGTDVSSNYNGVIAARMCGDKAKNSVVYRYTDGKFKGSFRGRVDNFDYRKEFELRGIKAEGHGPAFGFEADTEGELKSALEEVSKVDMQIGLNQRYMTLGGSVRKGEYHIENLEALRKDGFLWCLAYGNSNVGASQEIEILVGSIDTELIEESEKYFKYKVLGGLECISFERLVGYEYRIYAEMDGEIKLFIRNVKQ